MITGLLFVFGPEVFVARLPSGLRTSGGMCGVLNAYPFWMGGGGGGRETELVFQIPQTAVNVKISFMFVLVTMSCFFL